MKILGGDKKGKRLKARGGQKVRPTLAKAGVQ
jgi:16S rRNA G966 N2-methylase RsmD